MEEALERYYRHFREDYPLMIAGTKPEKEIIERINHCIETNQPESEPDYDEMPIIEKSTVQFAWCFFHAHFQ